MGNVAALFENRATRLATAAAFAVIASVAGAGSAMAASTIGQLFAPNTACPANVARLQANVTSGKSYTVPSDGVITSWSFQTDALSVSGLKLKVGRPGGGTQYTVVGESAAGSVTPAAVNTRSARIPVKKGDYIGVYTASGHCGASTANDLDIYAQYNGDPPVGSTSTQWPYRGNFRIPVQAKVEPDADHDGFGDESQDHCLGTAGPNSGCPTTTGGGSGGGGGGSGGGSSPGGPSPPADTIAPVFLSARMTHKRFAVNRHGPAETLVTARVHRGTAFVYKLSEAARVVFTIDRRKSCRRRTRRHHCVRYVTVGSFAQNAAAGSNRKRFSGRLGRRTLRPGRYRATLAASDAAGNVSTPRVLAFRVVRR